jgi:hypothetical protein
MNPTIRTIAAIAVVSLAFQVPLTAGPKAVKPAKATVAKPMTAPAGSKPAKTTHAPVMKTTAGQAVKPVKAAKATAPAMKSAKTTAPAMKSAKTGAPVMKSAKSTAKADVKAAKVTAKSATVTAKADTKLAKSTAKADAKAAKHSSTTTAGTTSDSTSGTTSTSTTTTDADDTTAPIVVSNPIADKIARNPKLAAKIASRLPPDMTLAQASTGFKNQGQFLAAVNVSRNLGIDFVKLQTAMTGQKVTVDQTTHAITTTPTGDAPLSLGRAIQTLKPGVDADAAVQTAQTQTSQMVQ